MPPFARDRDRSFVTRFFGAEQSEAGCARPGHSHEMGSRLSREPCEHQPDLRNERCCGFLEVVPALAPFAKWAAVPSIPGREYFGSRERHTRVHEEHRGSGEIGKIYWGQLVTCPASARREAKEAGRHIASQLRRDLLRIAWIDPPH